MTRPTAGTVRVLGRTPDRDIGLLPNMGFMAQHVPLYRSFTLRELLEFGRRTNRRWDGQLALARLERVGIDLGQRAGTLSGGQWNDRGE